MSMLLSELVRDFSKITEKEDCVVQSLNNDSREITAGDVFVAWGSGFRFITQAIERGAVAVIVEAGHQLDLSNIGVPVITLSDLSQQLGKIAAKFYGYPSQKLRIIGVTGTNGKTSTSQYIARCCERFGLSTAVIGTLGYGFLKQLRLGKFTTPDAIQLQKLLQEFLQQGAQAVSMEISSHALAQGRDVGMLVETAVFTNLTRDHLDYHGDMNAYGRAKELLFQRPDLKRIIINGDDEFGQYLIRTYAPRIPTYVYGLGLTSRAYEQAKIVSAVDWKFLSDGMQARINTPWGEATFKTKLLGRFNLYNLLAVVTTLGAMDYTLNQIIEAIEQLECAPGRMHRFGGDHQPTIVVDYAHTPDALRQVMMALRDHCQGDLYCVFGCGGDRDQGKRPLMAEVVESYADHIIVTDDNPRHEDSSKIIKDILQGFQKTNRVTIQPDRATAIQKTIAQARVGDVVLVAGKGHETTQQYGDQLIPFSDLDFVRATLEKKR